MLKIIFKILAILILVVFQLTFINKFLIFGAVPNLILILAICLVLKNRLEEAFLVAVIGGLFLDLVSPLRFGLYTFLFLIILLVINFFLLKVIPTPNNSIAFFIFMVSFIFLDLVIFIFIKTWPTWELAFGALINSFWAVIIYSLVGPQITFKEKIQLA